jgi:hypothetical protein
VNGAVLAMAAKLVLDLIATVQSAPDWKMVFVFSTYAAVDVGSMWLAWR